MSSKNVQKPVSVGIDVGKFQLDLCLYPDTPIAFSNDEKGIQQAVKWLKMHRPSRIVVEATGRLEQPLLVACAKAKLPVCVINPRQVRNFARALNLKAKTDQLDAKVIALYGEKITPDPTPLKVKNLQLMSDLLACRSQLLETQTVEKNRLQIMPC